MITLGHDILYFKSLPSTSDYIKQRKNNGISEGTIVVAQQQTQGRGRGNNKWISEPGVGLYFSFIIKPDITPKLLGILSLSISVAMANALCGLTNTNIFVKWPNDIILKGKKIGGILVESSTHANRIENIIVGIGINLSQQFKDLPVSSAGSIFSITGLQLNKTIVLNSAISNLNTLLGIIQNQKNWPQIVQKNWMGLCCHKDKNIKIFNENSSFNGTFAGITKYGEAIIQENDGKKQLLTMGQFSLREV